MAGCAAVPAFDRVAAVFVPGVAAATVCTTCDALLATAIAPPTAKNDVTLNPARKTRVAAAGCRRRARFAGGALGAEPALADEVWFERPEAARRS